MPIKNLWVYLNITDPIVAWETYRGILISPDCYLLENNPAISFWQLKFLKNMESIKSINEIKIESIRQQYYPDKISRFRGFYYFENKETAQKAANLWKLDYMNPFCLTQVAINSNSAYSKLDSNWITYYLPKENPNDDWIHSYWKGEICPKYEEPIWELLVVAKGFIIGTELRKQAYENIKNNNPTTILPLLEQARIAAWLNSDLGHITPYITNLGANKYKVQHIINMRDAKNPKYLDKLKKYSENPLNKDFINHKDLGLINKYQIFNVPDTRIKDFEFTIPTNINFSLNNLSHS